MIARLRDSYATINTIDPSSPTYQSLISKLNKMDPAMLQQLASAQIKFVSGLARNRLRPTGGQQRTARVEEDVSPSGVHADILSKLNSEVMAMPYLSDEKIYKRAVRNLLIGKPVIPAAQVESMTQRYIQTNPYNTYKAAKRVASSPVYQEAAKLVTTQANGKKTAKIYKDTETGEFCVKFYVDGKYQKDADYFTDDKDDALGTAKAEIKRSNESVNEADEEGAPTDTDKSPRDIEKAAEPEGPDMEWISKFDLGEIKEAIQKIIDHLSETDDDEQIDLLRNDIRILDNLHAALGKKDGKEVEKHWKIAKSEGSAEHLHDEFNRRMDDAVGSKPMREGYVAESEDRATFKDKTKWFKAAKPYRVKETGKTSTAFCKETGAMMGRWSGEKGWIDAG